MEGGVVCLKKNINKQGGESERRKMDALSGCGADAVYLGSIQPSGQLLRENQSSGSPSKDFALKELLLL